MCSRCLPTLNPVVTDFTVFLRNFRIFAWRPGKTGVRAGHRPPKQNWRWSPCLDRKDLGRRRRRSVQEILSSLSKLFSPAGCFCKREVDHFLWQESLQGQKGDSKEEIGNCLGGRVEGRTLEHCRTDWNIKLVSTPTPPTNTRSENWTMRDSEEFKFDICKCPWLEVSVQISQQNSDLCLLVKSASDKLVLGGWVSTNPF